VEQDYYVELILRIIFYWNKRRNEKIVWGKVVIFILLTNMRRNERYSTILVELYRDIEKEKTREDYVNSIKKEKDILMALVNEMTLCR
jgi:hypothetical protein